MINECGHKTVREKKRGSERCVKESGRKVAAVEQAVRLAGEVASKRWRCNGARKGIVYRQSHKTLDVLRVKLVNQRF